MIIQVYLWQWLDRVLRLCLFSAFGLLTACAYSTPTTCFVASSEDVVVELTLGRQIDLALQNELKQGVFNGAVLVTKGKETILRRGYGCQDREQELLNSPDIISDIGSMAKTFTATGILILEEQGKVKLSNTLSRFYPDTREEVGAITIEQLMLHTSGLKDNVSLSDFKSMTRAEAEKKILNRSLKFTPGERYEYSNSGYTLLAAIIEHVTGGTFQDFVKREILVPLALKDTRYYQEKDIEEERLANGYGGWGARFMGLLDGWGFGDTTHSKELTWSLMGGGGMVSSVDDMQRWFQALSSGNELPESVTNKVFAKTSTRRTLGHWQPIDIKGTSTLQAGGATIYGYLAKTLYLPETDITVSLLFNSHSNEHGVRTYHHVSHEVILPIIVEGN
jgi:CubicO group peptidase (beta-lactamase class C family)